MGKKYVQNKHSVPKYAAANELMVEIIILCKRLGWKKLLGLLPPSCNVAGMKRFWDW